jgi:hypothetical protein
METLQEKAKKKLANMISSSPDLIKEIIDDAVLTEMKKEIALQYEKQITDTLPYIISDMCENRNFLCPDTNREFYYEKYKNVNRFVVQCAISTSMNIHTRHLNPGPVYYERKTRFRSEYDDDSEKSYIDYEDEEEEDEDENKKRHEEF